MTAESRPHVAILGAGPIGLEAALAAAEADLPFTLYEASGSIAANVRDWRHVRLFSPWDLNVSPRVRDRLGRAGLEPPEGDACPTGGELLEKVLEPLAELPEIAPRLRLDHRVVTMGRDGLVKNDEIGTGARAHRPFRLLVRNGQGSERIERADAVLDCTGSYAEPNALGDGGIPAPGEAQVDAAGRIGHRIPCLEDPDEAAHYAGRTTLLVGAGHSAQTAVRDLAELARREPGTRVIWALRGDASGLTPIADDPLTERAELMARAAELASGNSPAVEIRTGVVVESLEVDGERVAVSLRRRDAPGDSGELVTVDRVLALTGSVGDHHLYRQLQVHECYATSGPMKLAAALLGEAGGDCLAQTGHGVETLLNPEPGFFILGSKSYGRNSTFLLRVGWEQIDDVLGSLTRAVP